MHKNNRQLVLSKSNNELEEDIDIEIRPIRRRDAVEAGLDYWMDETDLVKERQQRKAVKNRKVCDMYIIACILLMPFLLVVFVWFRTRLQHVIARMPIKHAHINAYILDIINICKTASSQWRDQSPRINCVMRWWRPTNKTGLVWFRCLLQYWVWLGQSFQNYCRSQWYLFPICRIVMCNEQMQHIRCCWWGCGFICRRCNHAVCELL